MAGRKQKHVTWGNRISCYTFDFLTLPPLFWIAQALLNFYVTCGDKWEFFLYKTGRKPVVFHMLQWIWFAVQFKSVELSLWSRELRDCRESKGAMQSSVLYANSEFQFSTDGLRFLLPSIILADLSGNRHSLQLGQRVTSLGCDW